MGRHRVLPLRQGRANRHDAQYLSRRETPPRSTSRVVLIPLIGAVRIGTTPNISPDGRHLPWTSAGCNDFLRDVDKLASGLAKVLHIPEAALDRSVESIDLVDKALLRVTIAKRMTPEIFAPVTAYLGEVMRLVCDGRWGKMPATIKRRLPEYDPAELKPFMAAQDVASRAAAAAAEKAYADAKARRASEYRACMARDDAHRETLRAHSMPELKPIRYKEYDEPVRGHEHEPVLWAHDGALVQPVASVVRSLLERSTYGTLRDAVEGKLAGCLAAKRKATSGGGS
jgi:hypothetical protein